MNNSARPAAIFGADTFVKQSVPNPFFDCKENLLLWVKRWCRTYQTPLLSMKLAAFIILIASMQVSARGIAQGNVTISLKDVMVTEVFKEIEKQTSFRFLYRDELVKKAGTVTVTVKNASVEEVLNLCFAKKALEYKIFNATIVISEKNDATLRGGGTGVIEAPLPKIDVTGRVLNEQGRPVEGVTVTIKGTTISTSTNGNGEFAINSVEQDAVLIFSSVNLETFEYKVSGTKQIEVKLKAKVVGLGEVEVVMNTGYQSVSKERATGSFTKVDSALFHRQVSTDLISRLDGITNGLLFDKRSGGLYLQLRGLSTLRNSTDINGESSLNPLIVLDNFPFSGSINDINPNDVEDITILRDAAAASVWGPRAGNGVIVITTKKSKFNQPFRVSVTSNFSVYDKPDLFYFPQMSSSEFIDLEQYLFAQGKYDGDGSFTNSRQPVLSPVVEILKKQRDGLLSVSQASEMINSYRNLDIRSEYDKYVFRNPVNLQNHLSFNGGTNNLAYNLTVGYDNNISSIKGPGGFDRYTINTGSKMKPVKGLEITTGIIFTQEATKTDGLDFFIRPGGNVNPKANIYPYAQLADAQGNHLPVPYEIRAAFADTVGWGKMLDWNYRPLDEMRLVDNVTKSKYTQFNIGIGYQVSDWLTAEIKYQYSQKNFENKNHQSEESFSTRNYINRFTNPTTYKSALPFGGILDMTDGETVIQNLRGQLNLKKSFRVLHDISAMISGEIGSAKSFRSSNRIYGYNDDLLTVGQTMDFNTFFPTFFGGSERIMNATSLQERNNRSVAILGNASYSYDGRYTVYASARRDGSNLFGVNTNNKWKPLWSTGISWDVSREKFFRTSWLNNLKLRASYGYTGNVSNSVSALTTIAYSRFVNIFGNEYAAISTTPNPDLRWEEVNTINLGIDFGLFKNRIKGNIDWYRKKSTDVIASLPVDPTFGIVLNQVVKNIAHLKGNGVDVAINSQNIRGAIKWNTTINFSYSKTIVSKYFENFTSTPLDASINPREGEIAWGLYAYKFAGLDPANGDPRGFLGKQVSKDYAAIFLDSFQNQVLVGSSLPLYYGNVYNQFFWKQFSLSLNVSYRLAYYFRKSTINYSSLIETWSGHGDYSKRWQKPGDELYTTVPSLSYPADNRRDQFYAFSEVNVEKGDHFRLQDIRLDYTLNSKRRSTGIKTLRFYFYAANLNIMLWKASNSSFDPDYALTRLPPAKQWTVGVNFNL